MNLFSTQWAQVKEDFILPARAGCTFASDVASRINRMTRGKEGEGSRVAIDHVRDGQGGGSLQESSEETKCMRGPPNIAIICGHPT